VRDALADLHGEPPSASASASGDGAGAGAGAAANSNNNNDNGPECSSAAGGSVLGALVRTILSQNTTDATSARAYASLRQAFYLEAGAEGGGGGGGGSGGDQQEHEGQFWERVRTAPPGKVEDSIRVGGLADIKAARIRAILDTLVEEARAASSSSHLPSLEHLRSIQDDDEARRQLTRFNGVGPKTAACVLMFALQRDDFAVDTHVLSMAATNPLRWVPAAASREAAYAHLNARVPKGCKVPLHVLMVEHGKRCPACARGGRLATTKTEGGWLATKKGRAAAEALATGAARCPLAAAVARVRGGEGGGAKMGVGGGAAVVPKKEEEEEVEEEEDEWRRAAAGGAEWGVAVPMKEEEA
jgi:endonuclease III